MFYPNNKGKYGFSARCRACYKAYYNANRERIRASQQRNYQSKAPVWPDGMKRCSKCGGLKPLADFYKGQGRLGRTAQCKACRRRMAGARHKLMFGQHPERFRARAAVAYAVKHGKLIKPDRCSECNQKRFLDGHHEDYDRPLDVLWLCKKCHVKRHKV